VLVTRADLQSAWNDTAARFQFTAQQPGRPSAALAGPAPEQVLEDRVEQRLTERAATFEPGEFRAVLLEQSAGELSPRACALGRGGVGQSLTKTGEIRDMYHSQNRGLSGRLIT
jgi:hypothetical protein